jgi:hypothetical protein
VRACEGFEVVQAGGCVEQDAIFMLGDLDGVQDGGKGGITGGVEVGLSFLIADDATEEAEEGGDVFGGVVGEFVTGGNLLDAEMNGSAGEHVGCAGVAKAGDEVGVGGDGQLQAEGGDDAVVGKREGDVADGPGLDPAVGEAEARPRSSME